MQLSYLSTSLHETLEIGYQLGQRLWSPLVICFYGDLAAGKTTFIKGLVSGACQIAVSEVQSPTFTYLNSYTGIKTIHHFDLYRLRDIDEFIAMGFDDFFYSDGICCIEWSERIQEYVPRDRIDIHLNHLQGNQRSILITSLGKYATRQIC